MKKPELEEGISVSDILRPKMTDRRTFLRAALGGTVVAALGGAYYVIDDASPKDAADGGG